MRLRFRDDEGSRSKKIEAARKRMRADSAYAARGYAALFRGSSGPHATAAGERLHRAIEYYLAQVDARVKVAQNRGGRHG